LLLLVMFKYHKKKGLEVKDFTFFATVFAFIMVFFMPKMLDRFYFLAMTFAFINFCVTKQKNDYLMFLLLINMLFFMMFLHFLNYIFLYEVIVIYTLGWGSAFVLLLVSTCLVISRYGKDAFSKSSVNKSIVETVGEN